MNEIIKMTDAEQRFYDLLVDYEIMSMVQEFKTQVWTKTVTGYRRIDFVLVINKNENDRKGIYIEIDDPGHIQTKRQIEDYKKTEEIFNSSFPLLRFAYWEIFEATERVMNEIESTIDLMRGA